MWENKIKKIISIILVSILANPIGMFAVASDPVDELEVGQKIHFSFAEGDGPQVDQERTLHQPAQRDVAQRCRSRTKRAKLKLLKRLKMHDKAVSESDDDESREGAYEVGCQDCVPIDSVLTFPTVQQACVPYSHDMLVALSPEVPRQWRELPETLPEGRRVLNILFLPEGPKVCNSLPQPMLIININKSLAKALPKDEFHEKVIYELNQWIEMCKIAETDKIADPLANVKVIYYPKAITEHIHSVFDLNDWANALCDTLKPDSSFAGKSLDLREFAVSYRSSEYEFRDLYAVTRYFSKGMGWLRVDRFGNRAIFKNRCLTDSLDKVCALYASGHSNEEIFDFLKLSEAGYCILQQIEQFRFDNPPLMIISRHLYYAMRDKDIYSLLTAIGDFNLVREARHLPLK